MMISFYGKYPTTVNDIFFSFGFFLNVMSCSSMLQLENDSGTLLLLPLRTRLSDSTQPSISVHFNEAVKHQIGHVLCPPGSLL